MVSLVTPESRATEATMVRMVSLVTPVNRDKKEIKAEQDLA